MDYILGVKADVTLRPHPDEVLPTARAHGRRGAGLLQCRNLAARSPAHRRVQARLAAGCAALDSSLPQLLGSTWRAIDMHCHKE